MTTSTVLAYTSAWSPLELKTIELPSSLKPTQLLLKVSHVSLNPVDLVLKQIDPGFTRYAFMDFCGYVESGGSEALKRWEAGERICGTSLGTLTWKSVIGTYALVDTAIDCLIKPPARLSDAEAAAFPMTFGTAYQMLEKANLHPNSAVLVLGGATSVGQWTIQLCKLLYKCTRVVATCSESSQDFVRSLGADSTIDYSQRDLSNALVESGKYHAILDCIGGYDALRVWPSLLEPASTGSAYVTVASDAGPSGPYTRWWTVLFSLPRAIFRGLFGSYLGINYSHIHLTADEGWIKGAQEILSNPKAKITIDSIYALSDYGKAWSRVDSRRARGKVVIDMSHN